MSDFKVKMHQIQFRLGLRPDPAAGAYGASQTPNGFKSLLLRGAEGQEGGQGSRVLFSADLRTWVGELRMQPITLIDDFTLC